MAYDSEDITPPLAADAQNPKSAKSPKAPRRGTQRAGDDDIAPQEHEPEFVEISRAPDSKAGAVIESAELKDSELETEEFSTHGSPVFSAIKWLVVGGILLWLYFQLAGLFQLVLAYEGWRFWAALVVFALPVSLILYVIVKLFLLVGRLPKHDQVKGNLDTCDIEEKRRLKEQIKPYLRSLPNDYENIFKPEDRSHIAARIESLRKDSRYSDSNGWMDDFAFFQKEQEKCALDIVKKYCTLIALKTAACPWKIIDMVIVFVNLTLMITRIAKVYNRRVTRGGAFRLLCHWFVNIYVSGELGAITENAADKMSNGLAQWLAGGNAENVAQEGLGGLLGASMPILSKVAGKAAEGSINAYMAYRMGRRAIDEFRFLKLASR